MFILTGSIANAEYLKENGEVYYEMPYYEIKSKVKDADVRNFENFEERNKIVIMGKIKIMYTLRGKNWKGKVQKDLKKKWRLINKKHVP